MEKGKTGYLSATTDETEEALIERLVALQRQVILSAPISARR